MRYSVKDYKKLFVLGFILIISTVSVFSQKFESKLIKLSDIKVEKNEKSEVEKWREDLQFIATELPAKHKNLFHRLDREKFYQEIKELDAKIPTLTQNQVALEFERIVGLARDGHTWVSPLFDHNMKFQVLPINLYIFGDEMYIRKADAAYKDIVGGKVLKIGKVTTAEAYQKSQPIYVHRQRDGYKIGSTELFNFTRDLAGTWNF